MPLEISGYKNYTLPSACCRRPISNTAKQTSNNLQVILLFDAWKESEGEDNAITGKYNENVMSLMHPLLMLLVLLSIESEKICIKIFHINFEYKYLNLLLLKYIYIYNY